mmetsp:Transcript_12980/g.23514  ORF Transcript_12980/g.23514 Transcript_12980/m.23514 type:complete len:97 (+) Transcript_12980:126-416(+)
MLALNAFFIIPFFICFHLFVQQDSSDRVNSTCHHQYSCYISNQTESCLDSWGMLHRLFANSNSFIFGGVIGKFIGSNTANVITPVHLAKCIDTAIF